VEALLAADVLAEQVRGAALFEALLEEDDGGFTFVDYSGGAGTPWEWGTPDSDNDFGSIVTGGNGAGTKCWAVNLGDFTDTGDRGFYNASTDAALHSPVIDLTAVTSATLSFAQAMDIIAGDTVVVNYLDADNADANVGSQIIEDIDGGSSAWEPASFEIPATAIGRNIRIEWRLTTTATIDYIGWYIDDVVVTGS